MGARPVPLGPAGQAVRANVRRLRQAQRLTTSDLSAKLTAHGRPILPNGITKIEQGGRRVDVDDLAALAATLDVTAQSLLTDPFECPNCRNAPSAGFTCSTCGATTTAEGGPR